MRIYYSSSNLKTRTRIENKKNIEMMMSNSKSIWFLLIFGIFTQSVYSGQVSQGICSSGCAAVVCACYSAAGVTFGTIISAPGTPAAIIGCNEAFGNCMSICEYFRAIPFI